ncbi:MAG: hypothetical protein HWN81_23915 [Candidatus Lokiarchaeota archaeon]|nr:hypothetical protein [Candidatus Lokiarchaeota archaeon]
MRSNKRKTRTSLLSLTILSLFLIGILSTSIVASTTYQHTLTKGTDEFVVDLYNDAEWKNTVDSSLTPSDWFEGEANITNAKSKATLKGWVSTTWDTWDVFTSIFMQEFFNVTETFILLLIMDSQGYNETTINTNYANNYNLLFGLQAVWNYTTNDYEEKPSSTEVVIAFPDPLKYKLMLDDYNSLAEDLNGNLAIQFSGLSFPNVSADQFLWQLIFSGFATSEPHGNYLESLVNELGCENTTVSGSTLVIERYGITNYTVEISYGERGMMSSFTVKDISGSIIYQITSSNSNWLFYLILIIVAICSIALVAFLIIRKKRLHR